MVEDQYLSDAWHLPWVLIHDRIGHAHGKRRGLLMGEKRYKYSGISLDGFPVKGIVEASDEYEAIVRIRQSCRMVKRITPKGNLSDILSMEIGPGWLSVQTLSMLASQFSYVLRSGISLSKSVQLICQQTENKKIKRILEDAKESTAAGRSLADSLWEANSQAFPPVFLETIRAGECSGTLDQAFERLAAYYAKQHEIRQKLSAAMTYPSFVLTVAVIVVMIVMVKVVPLLTGIFAELQGELPLSTKLLIRFSNFFQNHLYHGIIVALAAAVVFLCYVRTENGRVLWNRMKLNVPLFGKIRLMRASGQFAHTLSVMLSSGLALPQALDVTAKSIENYMLLKETVWMAERVWEGNSLGDCMWERSCYPDALKEVCALGEKTGELEPMLKAIGDYFENQADYAGKRLIARLEPVLLSILAILTGFIVISIYMPLFTMYSLM